MQSRSAIQVLKKFCTPWLMEKEDFGKILYFLEWKTDFWVSHFFLSFSKLRDILFSDHLFYACLFHCRVERIFREINSSISEGSLVITLLLKKLPMVLTRFTALTGLLVFSIPLGQNCLRLLLESCGNWCSSFFLEIRKFFVEELGHLNCAWFAIHLLIT